MPTYAYQHRRHSSGVQNTIFSLRLRSPPLRLVNGNVADVLSIKCCRLRNKQMMKIYDKIYDLYFLNRQRTHVIAYFFNCSNYVIYWTTSVQYQICPWPHRSMTISVHDHIGSYNDHFGPLRFMVTSVPIFLNHWSLTEVAMDRSDHRPRWSYTVFPSIRSQDGAELHIIDSMSTHCCYCLYVNKE